MKSQKSIFEIINTEKYPLVYAVQHQPEAIQPLIDGGVNVNEKGSAETPLFTAIRYQPEAIQTLIDAGANVNELTYNGESLLSIAVRDQSEAILQTLIDAGGWINNKIIFIAQISLFPLSTITIPVTPSFIGFSNVNYWSLSHSTIFLHPLIIREVFKKWLYRFKQF